MAELVLAQGYTFFQLFAVLLLAWGITALFYRRTFSTLTRRRFFTLLLLRFFAVAAVVLLLFRPALQFTQENTQRKSVIFSVDTSESMGIADGNTVRLEQVKEKIKQWTKKLKQDFSLHLIDFADKANNHQSTATPAGWEAEIADLKATGKSTSLSWGLVGALSVMDGRQKVPVKEIEALFLFSDGQHNTVRSPADDASRLGIPVYAIGTGTGLKNSSSFKDVQVSGIQVPERLTLKNKSRITAEVDAVGLEGRTVKVILEEESPDNEPVSVKPAARKKLGEKELLLDAVNGAQEVMFEFKPETAGRTLYIARTELLGDEAIKENNERQKAALVIEPGIRVFYLEGTLRPEYGAIVERFLSKDPDLEFCAMVQTKPNVFQRRTNIEDLELKGLPTDQAAVDSFDVFIIGDIDSSYFKPEVQELFVNRVKSGAGLIMLGGYHSLGPGGYEGTPLGKILPVILGNRDAGQFSEPFMPKLTPEGANSTVFANISGFFPSTLGKAVKDGLPNLSGCTKVPARNPAATVLATCPAVKVPGQGGDGEDEMPVLAVQPVDNGRTAVFTGDTTRSWQQGPRAMNQDTPFMQFWGQFIRYVAKREGTVVREANVSAAADKAYYEPEESVTITATLKDAEGAGTDKGNVSAEIGNSAVKLEPVEGTPGRYIGHYQPKQIGQCEVKVSAQLDALTLNAPEKIIIDVGRPNMEFDQLDLNEELLTKIADAAGGRYAHITTADFLIDQLNRDVMKRKVIEQIRLAPPFVLWIFFVSALSAEWYLRRRYHLR
ncbi:MAG: VWA domain-containing protein [Planctomycetaceae bacterium]|jgi:uncharacterized membrane protein|nr:VWA domain-containing protein [Planctomycetaceae bacterium]